MESEQIRKPKPIISVSRAINWYFGNYIHSPNNALRGEMGLPEGAEEDMEKLRTELGDRKLAHNEFLEIVKINGYHDKYYRYKKYENDCPLCKYLGMK